MATPINAIKFHSTRSDGTDNANGKVYTYAAGTTTPQVTYTNASGITPNTNPIILDATGRASIYIDPTLSYKFVCQDSTGASVPDGTVDNITDAGAALAADLANSSNAAKGDALVAVKQPLSGAVARTQHDKNKETVTFKDFGAVGDGVTDDTAAILAGLTSGASVIDGSGLTYKLTSAVVATLAGNTSIFLKNAKFVSSGIPNNSNLINIYGCAAGSTYSISAVSAGSTAIVLSSGTVTKGMWLLLKSSDLWNDVAVNTYPSVTMGEWVRVASVAGLNVTLDSPVIYDYTTSPTVTIYALAPEIRVEDVTCTSDNTAYAHGGVDIWNAVEATAKRINGIYCGYAAVGFNNCVYHYSEQCSLFEPNASLGYAYAVVSAYATRSARHVAPYGRGCRHVVAHGGYAGVIVSTTIIDPQGDNQFEGVVDAHAAVDQQQVMFGASHQYTSANGKIISSQARRLTVSGAQTDKISNGIVWTPACTKYPSSASFVGCRIKAQTNALGVQIASTQPCEFVEIIGGSYEGGASGASGDGIQITYNSNLNTTLATPGTIARLIVNKAKVYGYQRGLYILGSTRRLKVTFADIDADLSAPAVAGSYPMYALANTQGDIGLVRLRGTVTGGDPANYNARFDKCNQVDADVVSYSTPTDVFYNDQSGAADALNRFNLRAQMYGDGATMQRYGTVTLNGTSTVVVNNKFARSGSIVTFEQMTTLGGTPGFPRVSSISSGTSISFVSSNAADTSTWRFRVDNPTTGP